MQASDEVSKRDAQHAEQLANLSWSYRTEINKTLTRPRMVYDALYNAFMSHVLSNQIPAGGIGRSARRLAVYCGHLVSPVNLAFRHKV